MHYQVSGIYEYLFEELDAAFATRIGRFTICETPFPRGTWWGRCSLWVGNAYGPTHTVGICYVWKVIGVMGSKVACRGVFEALIVPSYSFPFRENPLA